MAWKVTITMVKEYDNRGTALGQMDAVHDVAIDKGFKIDREECVRV